MHERWDEMNERFPSNSIVRMLSGIRSVNDPALAADVEAFIAEHPVPQGQADPPAAPRAHAGERGASVEREAERLQQG